MRFGNTEFLHDLETAFQICESFNFFLQLGNITNKNLEFLN